METLRLKMTDITKTFPGVKALDKVQLNVRPGSVHALIGENGAGKSTLMKCLFGLYHPDEGNIELDGEKVTINGPTEALKLGISMIQQELTPIPYRNVIDNIWAGRFEKKGIIVNEAKMKKKTEELLADLELNIPATALAKDLSVSQLQAVEIAKAVSYDARIIIMDEPTSSLTNAETRHLFKIIRRLKSEGRSIIYISHKLEELFEISDEITVMRDGTYVGRYPIEEISIDELIKLMVGRSMENRFPPNEHVVQPNVLLKVENFTSADPHSFKGMSFDLHKGEILGIGGLVGAQRTELVESVFGLRSIAEGKLYKNGQEIVNSNPQEAIKNGFAMLTEERRATGIIPMLSVMDNTLAVAFKAMAGNRFGILNPKKLQTDVEKINGELNVKTPSVKTAIQNLSGGNQQKVLICRWLLANSDILILDEPTRGIDVGAKYEIYRIMRELTKAGKSIIMVSSEMPELIGVSDRIMVMCEGRMTGILDAAEVEQTDVMTLATQSENKAKAVD